MNKLQEGFVPELQILVDELTGRVMDRHKAIQDASGPPWGSEKITNEEALARMAQYDDPSKAETFSKMSNSTLVKAAMQAIKLRKAAGETRDMQSMALSEPPLIPQ